MAKSSSKNEVFDNSLCFKDCKKNTETLNSKITEISDKLADKVNLIYNYKLALAQVESRLVEYKEREVKYIKKIRTLEYYDKGKMECIETLKKELETLKQEKEVVDGKLAGLFKSSKDLENLIESQRLDKIKDGLGYSVIPPPIAQLYIYPKKDLSWTGLPECADDTVTDYSRPSPTVEIKRSTSNKVEAVKKPSVRYDELYRKPSKKSTRVQRLERELKARTPIHKVDRGRSRPVMAWVLNKRLLSATITLSNKAEDPILELSTMTTLDKEEAIKVTEKKNLENDIEDETLKIDKTVNIKESRNHPLENVIENLNQRTLRPGLIFSVCLCARFQEAPKTSHLKAVKRIFRYIKGTTHLGLWYPKGTGIETVVYADSDHAGDYVDQKSTSSIFTFVGCCLTSWFPKKQTALAISTIESEYVSAKKACQQALWMKQALINYDIRLDYIPIMCDNKGAIDLSKNPVQHSRTKHIKIRHHFLRDNV
uniref:Copia protein n=1 Tax=Tanacetum cinerariifolium TaxID=118510 RepID=A0A6L2K6X0_TANCI|nr:copia protein [Tanacetum cinerariifolium]